MIMEEEEISSSYINLLDNPNPSLYSYILPSIPSTAIDRFLLGGDYTTTSSRFMQTNKLETTTPTTKLMTTVVPTTLDQAYLSNFASSSCNGYYSSNNPNNNFYGVGTMHNNSANGLFFEEVESQNSEVRHGEELSSSKHEEQSLVFEGWRSSKGKKRKACAIGQWSTDEDSRLKSLVEKHGERKWAFIAEKMVGRVGKQCRERWINHLRDNIKKDAWDEEEERMLVEAHEQFGNRWTEIAKKIPGRTENSIKNHWNATKRRQNSKRKNNNKNKVEPEPKNHPSILQDYIKNKYLNSATTTTTTTTTTTPTLLNTNTTPSTSHSSVSTTNLNNVVESPHLFLDTSNESTLSNPSHHEKLMFMNNQSCSQDGYPSYDAVNVYETDQVQLNPVMVAPDYMMVRLGGTSTNVYSDRLICDMLNGDAPQLAAPNEWMINNNHMMSDYVVGNVLYDSSEHRKDMDLHEMMISLNYLKNNC